MYCTTTVTQDHVESRKEDAKIGKESKIILGSLTGQKEGKNNKEDEGGTEISRTSCIRSS